MPTLASCGFQYSWPSSWWGEPGRSHPVKGVAVGLDRIPGLVEQLLGLFEVHVIHVNVLRRLMDADGTGHYTSRSTPDFGPRQSVVRIWRRCRRRAAASGIRPHHLVVGNGGQLVTPVKWVPSALTGRDTRPRRSFLAFRRFTSYMFTRPSQKAERRDRGWRKASQGPHQMTLAKRSKSVARSPRSRQPLLSKSWRYRNIARLRHGPASGEMRILASMPTPGELRLQVCIRPSSCGGGTGA